MTTPTILSTEENSVTKFHLPSDVVTLTEYEAQEIMKSALNLWGRYHSHDLNDDAFLYDIEMESSRLPSRLLAKLRRFRDSSNHEGVLLVEGLDVEESVATPCGRTEDPHWQEVPVATLTQVMIMSLLGPVISYREEKQGRLVQDVYPKRGQERRQENSGSVLLELHTEDGFLDTPPDFLSLVCLRPDHDRQAATVTCSIRQVLPQLRPEDIEVLYQERFSILYATSFTGDSRTERWSPPMSVLSGPRNDPQLVVDMHGMRGLDDAAQRVLDSLRDIFIANLVGAVLDRGQMVIVDNRTAVHGRTSFNPRYDDNDRWLRRCFSVSDLRKVRSSKASSNRVLQTIE